MRITLLVVLFVVPLRAGLNVWTPSLQGTAAEEVAIDPVDPAIAYAATDAGIFKTTDRGTTWTLVDATPSVHSIAVNPHNHANVVAGTLSGRNQARIRWSVDAGVTWGEAVPVEPEVVITGIAFDAFEPMTVYVSMYGNGFARSTDGGKTWTVAIDGLRCCMWDFVDTLDVASAATSPSIIYAASESLFASTNGGARWEEVSLAPFSFEVWTVTVSPVNPAHLYVTGYKQPRSGPMSIMSTDGGKHWKELPLPELVMRIAVDPAAPRRLYAAVRPDRGLGPGILQSRDGGETWSEFNNGLSTPDVKSVSVDPAGSFVYASTGEGVFVYEVRLGRRQAVKR